LLFVPRSAVFLHGGVSSDFSLRVRSVCLPGTEPYVLKTIGKEIVKVIRMLAIMVECTPHNLCCTFPMPIARVGRLYIGILHPLCVKNLGWSKLHCEFQN
jgi:hypothetical protein